ncbi:MAG: hypothetical protein M1820_008910 [Bogoriella megaspora]|nr:MAG: hypothetical protein M1820_008910 [Bogoriella megaspora]
MSDQHRIVKRYKAGPEKEGHNGEMFRVLSATAPPSHIQGAIGILGISVYNNTTVISISNKGASADSSLALIRCRRRLGLLADVDQMDEGDTLAPEQKMRALDAEVKYERSAKHAAEESAKAEELRREATENNLSIKWLEFRLP